MVLYYGQDIASHVTIKTKKVAKMKNMATVIADLQSLYKGAKSKTTASEPGIDNANTENKGYYLIHPGVGISISHPQATAIVIQPFVIEIAPSEEEYLATSRISNVYELGALPGQAVMRYLKSLVDELVWLQKHQDSLSASIREELRLLQSYIQIV